MVTPPLACMASEERMPSREWVRSETRAENPRIRKEEEELNWIPGCRKGRQDEAKESEVV